MDGEGVQIESVNEGEPFELLKVWVGFRFHLLMEDFNAIKFESCGFFKDVFNRYAFGFEMPIRISGDTEFQFFTSISVFVSFMIT